MLHVLCPSLVETATFTMPTCWKPELRAGLYSGHGGWCFLNWRKTMMLLLTLSLCSLSSKSEMVIILIEVKTVVNLINPSGDLYTLKLDPKLSQLLKLYCSILFNLFLNCLQGLMGSCWGEFRTGWYRITAQLKDAVGFHFTMKS